MPYLTKRAVDALEPQAKPYFVWDGGDRSVKVLASWSRQAG